MSPRPGWARLLLASLIALPLAVISAAQALSSASVRSAPDAAAAIFPAHGRAIEAVAYRALAAGMPQAAGAPGAGDAGSSALTLAALSADLKGSAEPAASAARAAIRLEPLSVRAFIILALAAEDPAERRQIIEQAARLNRRDLALQVLVLGQKAEAGDSIGAIDTLDEILRVHPERNTEFFPLLVQALGETATVPAFARLLAQPLPWRDAFLSFALGDARALGNLAAVRERIVLDNPAFDQRLIAQLADSGQIALAQRIYQTATPAAAAPAGWPSAYPPFDWKLADQPGFRAQVGDRPELLEIDVAPGNGGMIAARLLRTPARPFALRLDHSLAPAAQIRDVKLALTCAGQTTTFFERPFVPGANTFAVDRVPPCPYLTIAIMARAWTGGRALGGTLSQLRITPLP